MARRPERKATPPPTRSFWQKYQWYIIIGVGVFFVFTLVVPALTAKAPEETTSPDQANASATRVSAVPGELHFAASQVDGRAHVPVGTRVNSYKSDPPTSGPHWSQPGIAPVAWGIYAQPLADEALVHNLEHGGIVIHYRSSAAQEVIDQLTRFVQSQPGGIKGFVLAPRATLPATVTLSAWEYYLPLFQVNESLMRQFISLHYNKGPESLEGGAR